MKNTIRTAIVSVDIDNARYLLFSSWHRGSTTVFQSRGK
jgi:hypothetical protein